MIRCLWGLVLVAVLLVPAATFAKEGTLEDYKLIIRNGKAVSEVSIRQLEKKLPQHTITTSTPWQKKAYSYTGPLVEDVLAYFKINADKIIVKALDDLERMISASFFREQKAILAIRRNGFPIAIADKGPVRIISNVKKEARVDQRAKLWIWMVKEVEAVR